MERNFEDALIELCAPTLAGIKPANLFNFETQDIVSFNKIIEKLSKQLYTKGLSISVLKHCIRANRHLVYVYRKEKLQEILRRDDIVQYLQSEGYNMLNSFDATLSQLSQRICCKQEFPHEIGIFLGYPLEDVIGFVENKGRNYTYSGYWKTYGDPVRAQNLFARYRKCTEIYMRCYNSGTPITRLAVAV